ncbi:MAG: glycosyltransferase [Deltaproteobacteria bacterium]|nr:glycosyltransferase [Deltaproteobacteria bacterium]
MSDLGCVLIGRNEGERLVRCLDSVTGRAAHVVYVDSGSTDGSVDRALERGAEVVELDKTIPFTAARARNAGFEALRAARPAIDFVQFVDGDCEVVAGWLEGARAVLLARPELAVVCGRRRERAPEASIYNRLMDLEWDTPVGEATACGGDAMMRARAFEAVGGFDATLIAGEEPELCFRLREQGWKIERLDREMTRHDAAMSRFDQWWKRTVRSGYAFAEGAWMHGRSPERYRVRETLRILFWTLGIPALAVGGAVPTLGASLLLSAGYPLVVARTFARTRRPGVPDEAALAYALFTALGKLPELQGVLRFTRLRLRGQKAALIEYK